METPDYNLSKKERRELKKQRRGENREHMEKSKRKGSAMNRILFVVIAVIIGYGFFAMNSGSDGSDSVVVGDHVKGGENAVVTLIEYGDFQCPACAAYHPILSQVHDKFGDKLKMVYRHFPLDQIHSLARPAGRAAEAAAMQGKFWEMHDILYERQDSWVNGGDVENIFKGYAVELGLDEDQFNDDYKSKAAKNAISAGRALGVKAGVNSTPSFYLNGKKIEQNPRSAEEFSAIIQLALNAEEKAKVAPDSDPEEAEEESVETDSSSEEGDVEENAPGHDGAMME